MKRWLASVLVAFGCGTPPDGGGGPFADAGVDATIDAAIDAYHAYYDGSGDGPPLLSVRDPASGALVPADYDCVGTYQDPPGAATEFSIAVDLVDDFSGAPVYNNARVAIYTEGSGGFYDDQSTDSNGHIAALRVPPNSYRVHFTYGGIGQIPTSYRNYPLPPTTTQITLRSISRPTLDSIGNALGVPWNAMNGNPSAVVFVTVRDCQRRQVDGAFGSIVLGLGYPDDSKIFYFGGQALPAPRTTYGYTGPDGRFLAWNYQGGTDIRVEAAGYTINQPQEITVSHFVFNFLDSVTFVDLPPRGP